MYTARKHRRRPLSLPIVSGLTIHNEAAPWGHRTSRGIRRKKRKSLWSLRRSPSARSLHRRYDMTCIPLLCPACDVHAGELLGTLGSATWYRCRMCGWEWMEA